MMPEPELTIFLKIYWSVTCFLDSLLRPIFRPSDYCCKLLCFRKAEWVIWFGDTVDDYTEACTRHVGNLLDDSPEFEVWRIEPVEGSA